MITLATLTAGTFIHLHCPTTRPPKPKFALVVAVQPPQALLFLVNSVLAEFVSGRPELLAQQIQLEATEYTWLTYDSWLDCADVHVCYEDHLTDAHTVDTAKPALVEQVAAVVETSRTLNRRSKEWIREAATGLLG